MCAIIASKAICLRYVDLPDCLLLRTPAAVISAYHVGSRDHIEIAGFSRECVILEDEVVNKCAGNCNNRTGINGSLKSFSTTGCLPCFMAEVGQRASTKTRLPKGPSVLKSGRTHDGVIVT